MTTRPAISFAARAAVQHDPGRIHSAGFRPLLWAGFAGAGPWGWLKAIYQQPANRFASIRRASPLRMTGRLLVTPATGRVKRQRCSQANRGEGCPAIAAILRPRPHHPCARSGLKLCLRVSVCFSSFCRSCEVATSRCPPRRRAASSLRRSKSAPQWRAKAVCARVRRIGLATAPESQGVPDVSSFVSSRTTLRQPNLARWYRTDKPTILPPMITARACRGSGLRASGAGLGFCGSRPSCHGASVEGMSCGYPMPVGNNSHADKTACPAVPLPSEWRKTGRIA